MYIPIGVILTIKGCVFDDTLVDFESGVKLPTKQKIQSKKSGYIQFIRNGDGVCDILRIVEFDFEHQEERQKYFSSLFFVYHGKQRNSWWNRLSILDNNGYIMPVSLGQNYDLF